MKLRDHAPNRPQLVEPVSIQLHRFSGDSPCAVCGFPAKSDFNVPEDVWEVVVPTRYWNKVVCVECFGNFACEKQIELFRLHRSVGAAQKWRGLIYFLFSAPTFYPLA